MKNEIIKIIKFQYFDMEIFKIMLISSQCLKYYQKITIYIIIL